MISYDGLNCPVCSHPFTGQDDIVVCPVCGAPHHRECWTQEGHCAEQDSHGTDRQWHRPVVEHNNPAPNICHFCGYQNTPESKICINCRAPLSEGNTAPPGPQPSSYNRNSFAGGTNVHAYMADPYGGVRPDQTIEDIPAQDIVAFLGDNSAYYLPRFNNMDKTKSNVNPNWAAFFLNSYWLLYRRLIKPFFIFYAIITILNIPNIILNIDFLIGVFKDFSYYLANGVINPAFMPAPNPLEQYTDILWYATFAVRLLLMFFGNKIYMNHVLKKIRKIRTQYKDDYDYHQALMTHGGVRLSYPLIFIGISVAVSFIFTVVVYLS